LYVNQRDEFTIFPFFCVPPAKLALLCLQIFVRSALTNTKIKSVTSTKWIVAVVRNIRNISKCSLTIRQGTHFDDYKTKKKQKAK